MAIRSGDPDGTMSDPVPADRLIGHRMNADRSFADRVHESGFSPTEWELIMSVVTFEIVGADDPDDAELHPVLDDLGDAISAIKSIPSTDPYASAGAQGRSGGGFLDQLRGLLSSGEDDERRHQEAQALVNEYTAFLEGLLRQDSVWDDLCAEIHATE